MVCKDGQIGSFDTKCQRPPQQLSFSPVKVPVVHQPPAGALSQTPFIQSSVPSGQAGPASGPDGTQTSASTAMNMSSPLENLYPETNPEPVFQQPGPISSAQSSSGPLHFPAQDIMSPDQIEEGEVSEPEPDDQQDSDSAEKDKVLSEDQNYRGTVRGVRAFMGWTHIPDLEYYQPQEQIILGLAIAPNQLERSQCYYHQKTAFVKNWRT